MSANEQAAYSVSWAEWRWVLRWSIVLLVICFLPYVLGYLVAQPHERFTGILMQGTDTNTYLAKVRLGLEGRWWFVDRFTPEPHTPMALYLPYIWWGLATRLVTRDPAMSYRLAQGVCNLGMLLAVYAFAALFFPDAARRRTASLLAALGAGIGWLTLPFAIVLELPLSAVDLWQPEATLFALMLSLPHFAGAVALLLVTMRAFWLQLHAWSPWRTVSLLVAPALMILIHPFLILTLTAVELTYSVIGLVSRRLAWRPLMLAWLAECVGMGPAFLIVQGTVWLHPVARGWIVDQGTMLSLPPQSYILGYGVLLVLAVWGGMLSVRRRMDPLPVVWLMVGALLPYAPTAVQRRLIEGFGVPLALLATVAWHAQIRPWLARLSQNWRSVVRVGLTLSIGMSNVVLWAAICAYAVSHTRPWFVSESEAQVWAWLREDGLADIVVLSSPETGNSIPAHTNKRVVVGHWAETLHYSDKVKAVESFFDPATEDTMRAAILEQFDVQYVVWGPAERALGALDPHEVPQLCEAYINGEFTVFRVVRKQAR